MSKDFLKFLMTSSKADTQSLAGKSKSELLEYITQLKQRLNQVEKKQLNLGDYRAVPLSPRHNLPQTLDCFELIMKHSLDGICVSKTKLPHKPRKIVLCNDTFIAMSGRRREELLARDDINDLITYIEAFGPDDMNQYLRNKTPFFGRGSWCRPDKKSNVFEYTAVPFSIDHDNSFYVVSIERDITKRIQVEKALSQSEEKYRTLVEGALQAIFTINYDGVFLFMNREAASRLGGKPQDYIGKTMWDLFPPLVADQQMKSIREVIDSGESHVYEAETILNGKSFWYQTLIQPLEKENGRYFSALSMATDISDRVRAIENLQKAHAELETRVARRTSELHDTNQQLLVEIEERRRVERQLRESELRYRTLFENCPLGITLTRLDGTIITCNKHILDLTGYTLKEFRQYNAADFYGDPELRDDLVSRTLTKNTVKDFEMLFKYKNGSSFIANIHMSLLNLENDQILLTVIQNISERKKAETRLLDYQRQLRSLASQLILTENQERQRIANELHDRIGQSLAFTMLQLGNLRNQCVGTNENCRNVDEISRLVSEIIQETRSLIFDIGTPIFHKDGLVAAIEDWLEEKLARKHKLKYKFHYNGVPDNIDTHIQLLLFESIRELLVNVVKHAQAQFVTVTMKCDDNHIHIMVEDNGVGFDPEVAMAIDKKRFGFGLFSIQQRLDHLNGKFSIHSRIGHGTIIELTAPLRKA